MDLTPIKVRGRRKRRSAPVENNNIGNRRKKPKGRPLLPPQTVSRSSSSSQRSRSLTKLTRALKESTAGKQTNNANRSAGRLTVLETLPVELLEKIFLYSLNVNLPRASPSLAAALSSERLYRVLILLAFWDDHDYDHENDNDGGDTSSRNVAGPRERSYENNILRILRPLEHDYVPLTSHQKKMLQSTILRCRWCTVERIQRQLPELFRLIITRRWINAGITMSESDNEQQLAKLLSGQEERDGDGLHYFVGTKDGNPTSQEGSYMVFFLTIKLWERVIITISTCSKTNNQATKTTSRLYPILKVKELPSSLLRGEDLYQDHQNQGFTDRQTTYLETLYAAGGFKGTNLLPESETRDITFSRDALHQGVHTAIVTRNPRALSVLLDLDEYLFRSLHGYGNRDGNGNQTDRVPLYMIPSDHFRTAAKLGINNLNDGNGGSGNGSSNEKPRDDAVALFGRLLRASGESVPYDDWVITQFAMDVGGSFGEWLLGLMMDLPRHVERAKEDPRTDTLFYMGWPNEHKEMARRYAEIFGLRL